MFRGIAPTRLRLATAWQAERGGYSLREMAQQHGPFQYFNSLLASEDENEDDMDGRARFTRLRRANV